MIVNIVGVSRVDRLKSRMTTKRRELNIDLAVQNMVAHRKNKRMICFDMDSTSVDMEGIDEMARKAGVLLLAKSPEVDDPLPIPFFEKTKADG